MPTPAVVQYPTRADPATRGRKANVTSGRWATIRLIAIGDDDEDYEREEIINISMTIPADRPPELPGLASVGTGISYKYFLERVALGVKIGMIRHGTIDPVGDWGYDDVSDQNWVSFRHTGNGAYLALFEDI